MAWCSTFLNWVFKQAGYVGTESALARSWLTWGKSLSTPRVGCVVILERESPTGWQGHVGLYLKEDDGQVFLLGGNQLDEVRVHSYDASTILGLRWPAGITTCVP